MKKGISEQGFQRLASVFCPARSKSAAVDIVGQEDDGTIYVDVRYKPYGHWYVIYLELGYRIDPQTKQETYEFFDVQIDPSFKEEKRDQAIAGAVNELAQALGIKDKQKLKNSILANAQYEDEDLGPLGNLIFSSDVNEGEGYTKVDISAERESNTGPIVESVLIFYLETNEETGDQNIEVEQFSAASYLSDSYIQYITEEMLSKAMQESGVSEDLLRSAVADGPMLI